MAFITPRWRLQPLSGSSCYWMPPQLITDRFEVIVHGAHLTCRVVRGITKPHESGMHASGVRWFAVRSRLTGVRGAEQLGWGRCSGRWGANAVWSVDCRSGVRQV